VYGRCKVWAHGGWQHKRLRALSSEATNMEPLRLLRRTTTFDQI
jgi:hypothetical protein